MPQSRLLLATLAFSLLACQPRASGPNTTPQPGDGGNPAASLDVEGCSDPIEGTLSSPDGQILFRPAGSPANRAVMIRHTNSVFSTILPHPTANHAFAVRTTYERPIPYGTLGLESEPVGRDELVAINGETLEMESLWAPGSRLLLMGRVGGRAVPLHGPPPESFGGPETHTMLHRVT